MRMSADRGQACSYHLTEDKKRLIIMLSFCPQEKRDKVALLAEVLKLRISNQHLKEESLCAVEQLHKISNILNPELEDYKTTNPNM